jgi:hypothetical protein
MRDLIMPNPKDNKKTSDLDIYKFLAEKAPLTLKNLKKSCDVELDRYIKSHRPNSGDKPSGLFNDPDIKDAIKLQSKIDSSESLDDIRKLVIDSSKHKISKDFEITLAKCLNIVDSVKSQADILGTPLP